LLDAGPVDIGQYLLGMGHEARAAARWWTALPARQVSYLIDVDPELLGVALDPLPADAPTVVRFRPTAGGSPADQVAALLDELDRAAVALFPLAARERLTAPPARRRRGTLAAWAPPARAASARSRRTGRTRPRGLPSTGRPAGPVAAVSGGGTRGRPRSSSRTPTAATRSPC
jgi:hypothetical protein